MKHPIALTVAALALPALIAAALPVDKVEFHPADGLSLTRTYSQKTELSLDDMEMSLNGQPSPMQIEMEMDMTMNQHVVVSDEISSVSEGRPAKLVRSFDELSQQSDFKVEMQQMPQGNQERSIKAESELQGKKVTFTWDADSGSYKTAFEGEGDAALLEGLEQDMDLTVLLPTTEVKEDDTWQIDVKRLRTLLAYGGNLKLKPTEGAEGAEGMPGMDNMTDFSSVFGELLEGDAKGEYRGTREVDGTKCQVIHVKLDVNASADISDKVREAMKDMPNEQIQSIKVERMDLEMELDGEGDLYWDPAKGVAHSFELTGTTTLNMDMGMAVSAGEQPMNIEQSFKLSGSFANSIAIRPN
jgi:hypothetical protein